MKYYSNPSFGGMDKNCKMSPRQVTIKAKELWLVNSTMTIAKKNLKKMEKVYDYLNQINIKTLSPESVIYYELWFMFIVECIHIQKIIIEYFQHEKNGEKQPITIGEIVYKIKMMLKPISVPFLKVKTGHVKLFIPEQIFNKF
ncbi:hypothetical protein MIV015R [Invertebrate iridescent virus 3]|uniref:Uncharacterized protein 015R n=1 Tax=Invertebrate iridescent virus 3 TaxID=345201 RepID=VF015_IIV3|nr:hypothetical protein MIV015R [Invertebrate iridescent virus 3]Q197E5.1 RecName: Full=Uncharacterized protein 015R [Invertebrate iridescent virus 3]ABF82045.1 hypothetical protein MIV015R [Invertebrate iridescent virus 3]